MSPKSLFSRWPARGKRTRKIKKYNAEAICPMMMYGSSTGIPPIHVRIATSATRDQKINWEKGRNVKLRCLDVCRMGTNIRIRIEARSANTPPNLLGMDRRMAYANRKYHSGLM